ncbi:hypothetical protein [Chitinophaga alhagiae]|uniref:hypothetical protein n=1 Tax=Chitinophaga alhagiae TaxID=2203219 RepID=UPI000E5BA307|nr:hypothetical protein [Chitinophaga alhagiae]
MKQDYNSIMRGASGALGNELVFRQRAGKTVISKPPAWRPDNPTEEQVGIRSRFQQASRYAKIVLGNPALKAAYKKAADPGVSAFNKAIADHFTPPVIRETDAVNYTGSPGDTIRIHATDDFRVQAVHVTITNAAGNLVEEGQAVPVPGEKDIWLYTATTSNGAAAGGKVKVQVNDLPGNVTEEETVL